MLGKLPVPGRPTYLEQSRAGAYCACSRCGWALFGHFFLSSIISLFFLPLSGPICLHTVSKGREAQNNQPTNYSLQYKIEEHAV